MAMTASARLVELGISLPEVVPPLASYVPAVQSGVYVYTAGQLPMVDGEMLAVGKVGSAVDEETARACARACALNAVAAVVSVVGDIDRIRRIVKVVGFVASEPALGEIFGDAGVHARSAVGVAVLPKDAPVEVEMIVEVAP
jgi:enamine deaminase RidA (YjgF/YER057c/UK114 family)